MCALPTNSVVSRVAELNHEGETALQSVDLETARKKFTEACTVIRARLERNCEFHRAFKFGKGVTDRDRALEEKLKEEDAVLHTALSHVGTRAARLQYLPQCVQSQQGRADLLSWVRLECPYARGKHSCTALLRNSVEKWNCFRTVYPDVPIDLRGADLCRVSLRGANLSNADLREALLMYTDLTGANLTGADLRGASLWSAMGMPRELFEQYVHELRRSVMEA